MRYNYYKNVKEDVKEYIKENYNNLEDIDKDSLYDDLFIADSVTGNASGSYYCNEYRAQESLIGNFDLVRESLEYFGNNAIDIELLNGEWLDVTIRCYVLGQVMDDAIQDFKRELENEG